MTVGPRLEEIEAEIELPSELRDEPAGTIRSGPQVLVEPIERASPGFFRRRLIVAGGRVVVEAVVGALVDVTLVRNAAPVRAASNAGQPLVMRVSSSAY